MNAIAHTLENGFCTVCGETRQWLIETDQPFTEAAEAVSVPEDFTIELDGVRKDDKHALLTNERLTPGERVSRTMKCRCGKDFGKLYDNAAKGAYRLHRKELEL